MKIKFSGWSRTQNRYERELAPVTRENVSEGRYILRAKTPGPLEWDSSKVAYAKIDNLALNGSFLMRIEFSERELKNWLRKVVEENPSHARTWLDELYATAVINSKT
jgi:hypothetical protein